MGGERAPDGRCAAGVTLTLDLWGMASSVHCCAGLAGGAVVMRAFIGAPLRLSVIHHRLLRAVEEEGLLTEVGRTSAEGCCSLFYWRQDAPHHAIRACPIILWPP